MTFLRIRPLAVLMALGSLAPALAGVPDEAGLSFKQHEIPLGDAERQTLLTGFLLGGTVADLAALHVDPAGDRSLRIYAFADGDWAPALEATLGSRALFVDSARIGGRERLITYEPGRLDWFDPDSATRRELLRVAWSYRGTDEGVLPQVDITRDLNGDGRDDLVLPAVDGFWVSTQRSDGSFVEPVKLGPPEPFAHEPVGQLDVGEPGSKGPRTYGELGITAMTVPVYLSRVHEMDYDRDGRNDLVFWHQDHFDVHVQEPSGQFSEAAETFAPGVPFDSEGVYSRAFEYADSGMLSLIFGLGEKTERTVLHSLRDLNDDGVADLVTLTLGGRSITRQRSVYRVHLGRSTPAGIEFAPQPAAVIRPRGRAGGMQPWGYSSQLFRDIDADGRVDLLFQDVRVGFGGMMRALVGNSVPINLELYRCEDGSYPDQPTVRRKIRRFAPFAGVGNVFFPPVLMGDVNGDGRSDLVVGQSPKELHVFLGVPGPEVLARRPEKVAVALPADERKTRLVDLDADGRQDLLIHRGPTDRLPDEPQRVTMLIVR